MAPSDWDIRSAPIGAFSCVSIYDKQCPLISHLAGSQRRCLARPVVTEGTLPAREAFETADALFTVEKESLYPVLKTQTDLCQTVVPIRSFGVVRTDTQAFSVSSKQYDLSRTTSFGWPSSSARRLTWTASSFYQMVPKSALPPHSVVRRRTSSLVTRQTSHCWLPRT